VLCRIDCRREEAGLVVHLAGRLCEAQVPELLAACAHSARPVLELDELISADPAGLDALFRLEYLGARLMGLPEYRRAGSRPCHVTTVSNPRAVDPDDFEY
jgi:hypothetical protein